MFIIEVIIDGGVKLEIILSRAAVHHIVFHCNKYREETTEADNKMHRKEASGSYYQHQQEAQLQIFFKKDKLNK